MHEVIRRTGLTRRQLRYVEERDLIGMVERVYGRRMYAPAQVAVLESLGRLRHIGVSLDEAALIAAAAAGRPVSLPAARLSQLLRRAQRTSQLHASTAAELSDLLERQLTLDASDTDVS